MAVSSAEVLDVMAVGVCGSDIHRLRSGFDVRSLGHELVGRRPGDGTLAAIRPLNPCRVCPACRRGWTEQCASDVSIGRLDTGQGGFSGRIHAQPGQLYPLPAYLPIPVATLADPLACIVHALDGMSLDGKTVLIIGDGSMGAIAAVYARLCAARVSIAVKDATGISSAPILTAILAVAPLGQVVALGVYCPDLAAVIPVRTLLEKESTLRGSKAYRVSAERDDFATALEHLATSRDAYSPIITCTPPWSPDDTQPPELERRNGTLKTVYVRVPAGPDDT